MKFTVNIECSNDAFAGGNMEEEVSRILGELSAKLAVTYIGSSQEFDIPLFDLNGNKVGKAAFKKD
jgi:hypothetical protein